MTLHRTAGLLLLLTAAALGPQNKPAISGAWVIHTSTAVGGRAGAASQKPALSTVNTASGAAFNCGRECTIEQQGSTLRVSGALLGSDKSAAPIVEFQLDGREASVVDSFNPKRQIKAIAKWTDGKVEIVSWSGPSRFTQTLSLEDGQLVVMSVFDKDPAHPVLTRYQKK